MANPNLVNVATIYGNNLSVSLTTTNATSLVSNAASSGYVYKVNTILVANTDGTNAYTITINKYSAAALGGTAYQIASTISVPANSTLAILDRTMSIYLKENESIGATAGTASKLVVTASWEELA